jgi:hypothetical protein
MLAVKKQDTDRDNTYAPALSGFGKVLGSIQGLQQRLSEFSYGEVSIAEAKVKMLVKQLTLVRDNLDNLTQLKLAVGAVNRRIDEIPVERFDEVNLDSLENHPQLHAILQASNLVRSQRLMKDALAGSEIVSPETISAESPNHPSTAKEKEDGTVTTVERPGLVDKKQPGETEASTRETTEDTSSSDRATFPRHTTAARDEKIFAADEERPSFTIPNESIAVPQDLPLDGHAKEWSFDLHESFPASSETLTGPINFEFPLETVEDHDPVATGFSTPKLPQTEPPPSVTITQAPRQKPSAIETKPVLAVRVIPAKPAADKSAARFDDSKALVLAGHDFDQRLIDDVIKHYGDFAVTPNLPATLRTSTKIAPVTNEAAKKATAELAKSAAAAERNLLNVQKSGDLDRQLKKIIKDYGEYDIYERKSVFTFKTGGIVAFAVLGLVLAVLYLFQAPRAASTPQARSVTQPLVAEPNSSPEAVKSTGAEERRIGLDAANASSTPLTDIKP